MGTITILILLVSMVLFLAGGYFANRYNEKRRAREYKEENKEFLERCEKEDLENKRKAAALDAKYGTCTKAIKWWFDESTDLVRVYEDAKKVAIKYEVFDFSDLDEIDYVDEGKEYREENGIPETVYDGHNYVFTILTRDAFRPVIRFHIGNDAYQKFDIMRTISEIIEKNGRASKDAASWWNETSTDKRL